MDIPTERAMMRVVCVDEAWEVDCDSERGRGEETDEIVETEDVGCVVELVCRRVVCACGGSVVSAWEEVERVVV